MTAAPSRSLLHFEKNDLMIAPYPSPTAGQPLPAATAHHPPQARLTPRLIAPAALALAALLATAPSTRAAQTDIPGPAGSGTFGKAVTYLPNGNFVVTDPTYSLTTPTAVASVGAVYLYNGSTLALISTLTGSTASDQVGSEGVIVLSNGNFVVRSSKWDNGAAADAGAVTWGSATAGVSGTVSATNSLVGSTASDNLGLYSADINALTNGNYVVGSRDWNNGAVVDAGAVTWGNGTTGISGTVSATNSLVGSNASDKVGRDSIVELTNGNYVVRATTWNGSRGAVTWCNGASGSSGVVSATNSLVGSTAVDEVGKWVSALTNGNYATTSFTWDNGAVVDAGAVTWGNGTTGTKGAVSATNSLVGSTLNDLVGSQISSSGNTILVLDNGNFVVASSAWNNGAVVDAGAVTWCNGTGGTVGTISAANSLVGSTANDKVANRPSNNALFALSNGNYIVISVSWDNGAVVDAGAVTWGNGTTGTKGAVSATNSLVGSKTLDFTKARPLILSNGNYVVGNGAWDNGTVVDAGALTWCNGTGGTVGTLSAANSLVGSTASDSVGSITVAGLSNINATALTNGNYVAHNPAWDNGAVVDAGAVTWCNGTGGTVGTISAANSLVGSTESDQVGSGRAIALRNGNYVVGSPNWNNGAVGSAGAGAGAATWGNGTGGTVGAVSAANSLVSSASDGVGINMHALANGNYVVRSIAWDNGAVLNAGAVTWGSGTTGISGTISAANSLVGSSASDAVGTLFVELSNSNFVVGSPGWDNGAVLNAGAVTWGSGTTGTTGAVSAANSLVGSTLNDGLGSATVALSNGNYLVRSSNWDNGALTQAGAITLGNGSGGTAGAVSAVNSVLGTVAAGSSGLVYSYNATADKLLVGQPSAKQVTLFDKIPVVVAAPSDATAASGASVSFTATASGDPAPTLQWQVSANGGVNWTDVDGATASPYTFTASAADTGKKYRVVFTNAAGSATSTAATLTVTLPQLVISTWPGATAITYGQTLASSTLSGGLASAEGTFAFTSPGTVPAVGTADQAVTFTPTDAVNYSPVSGTASVTVQQATPTVTIWPGATAITYGQTLASSTLSGGTASVAGTFAFTSPGTTPAVGTATQAVTFTPADAVNYSPVSGIASVTVQQATPTVTTWPGATAITYGQTLASSTLSGGTASVAGTFAFTSPGTVPAVGTADQAVTFTPTDAVNYTTVSGTASVLVNQATATVVLGGLTAVDDGTAKAASATTVPAGLTVGLTYDLSATAPSLPGTYAVVATVSDPNYVGSASGSLVISPKAPVFSGYSASSKPNQAIGIARAKILSRASDPYGGKVALPRVFGPSAQGGTVSLAGNNVTYTPATDFVGVDTFEVELTNPAGGVTHGLVTITVTGAGTAAQNLVQLTLRDGVVDLVFQGIPGRVYVIQRSANLTSWTTLVSVTAAADGKIKHTDANPLPSSGFYRTQE